MEGCKKKWKDDKCNDIKCCTKNPSSDWYEIIWVYGFFFSSLGCGATFQIWATTVGGRRPKKKKLTEKIRHMTETMMHRSDIRQWTKTSCQYLCVWVCAYICLYRPHIQTQRDTHCIIVLWKLIYEYENNFLLFIWIFRKKHNNYKKMLWSYVKTWFQFLGGDARCALWNIFRTW